MTPAKFLLIYIYILYIYIYIQIHMIYITLCPKPENSANSKLSWPCPHPQAALLRALPGALEKLGLGAPPERCHGVG